MVKKIGVKKIKSNGTPAFAGVTVGLDGESGALFFKARTGPASSCERSQAGRMSCARRMRALQNGAPVRLRGH